LNYCSSYAKILSYISKINESNDLDDGDKDKFKTIKGNLK